MSRSPCRTRGAAQVPTEFPPRFAARPATGPQVRVRKHVTRQVVILEVADRLSDVVEELDLAIQPASADGPRGVVCDLSAVFEGAEQGAVAVLATAGRHVRDWPGIPVAVACPDPRVRAALTAHPLGGHLIVTASVLSALSEVLATPAPAVEWLGLAPHPSAPLVTSSPVPCWTGVGQGYFLRFTGGQRARGQLDDPCRHRHRPVRGLERRDIASDRSGQQPWPASPEAFNS